MIDKELSDLYETDAALERFMGSKVWEVQKKILDTIIGDSINKLSTIRKEDFKEDAKFYIAFLEEQTKLNIAREFKALFLNEKKIITEDLDLVEAESAHDEGIEASMYE